jgi:hypothetical protein
MANVIAAPLQPEFISAVERGNSALQSGSKETAQQHYDKAARMNPIAWGCIASKALKDGDYRFALDAFSKTLEYSDLPKARALALNDLGMMLWQQGSRDLAEQLFKQANGIDKRIAEVHHNLAMVASRHLDYQSTFKHLNTALSLSPRFDVAYFSRSLANLITGNYAEGWREYEYRWKNPAGKLKKPELPGDELRYLHQVKSGTRLLLYCEQGAGDTIQMLRYVPRLAAMGAVITLVVQKPIINLARAQFFGDVTIEHEAKPGTPYNYHLPLLSLPRIFGENEKTIKGSKYLSHPPVIEEHSKPTVGIAWAGSGDHQEDRYRSIEIEKLADLFNLRGIEWRSFQVGPHEIDLLASGFNVTNLAPRLTSYFETARELADCDLLVSVDTSVVHLAGALGVPCWVMLPYNPDWRWLLNREDSPWYDSLRLFRQGPDRQWEPVIERVRRDLIALHNQNAVPIMGAVA